MRIQITRVALRIWLFVPQRRPTRRGLRAMMPVSLTTGSGSSRWNSANGETAGVLAGLNFGSPTTFDTVGIE
jgi:hypothetical protein